MEKDNSNSKSVLQICQERMNEEITKFYKCALETSRKMQHDEWIIKQASNMLSEYSNYNAVSVKKGCITTEKKFKFDIQSYHTYSKVFEYQKMLEQKKQELDYPEFNQYSKEFLSEISSELNLNMKKLIDELLIYINENMQEYTLYLKESAIENLNILNLEHGGITGQFVFYIDIE